jgi:hypothetical protein
MGDTARGAPDRGFDTLTTLLPNLDKRLVMVIVQCK